MTSALLGGFAGTPPSGLSNNIVWPEQFASPTVVTDDQQFGAAIAAIAPTGGHVLLKPGKTYNWVNPPPVLDFAQYGNQIVIEAWGAIVNANYAGVSYTMKKSLSGSSINTIIVLGGEWNNVHAAGTDFWLLQDVSQAFFFRVKTTAPNGAAWHQSNVQFFSENNHYIECYDPGSKWAIQTTNDGSTHQSMARTTIRMLRVQGGVAGEPKLNIGDNTSLYHGVLDGMTGNLAINAIGIKLNGNMHGFVIQGNIGMECSVGTPGTDYAYYFTVGTMTGGVLPELHTNIANLAPTPPAGNTLTMQLMAPASTQPALYNAITLEWGVLGVGTETSTTIPNASPVALPATTETAVYTLTLTPGEYLVDASMCVNFTTVSTASNIQCRVNGGTATFTTSGKSAAQVASPSAANTTNQTVEPRFRCHVTVTVAGTVVITARASSVAQVCGTSPASGYSAVSSCSVLQVA